MVDVEVSRVGDQGLSILCTLALVPIINSIVLILIVIIVVVILTMIMIINSSKNNNNSSNRLILNPNHESQSLKTHLTNTQAAASSTQLSDATVQDSV